MKIEFDTKYNIGDEVWYFETKVCNSKIVKINVIYDAQYRRIFKPMIDRKRISYTLKSGERLNENELFLSKAALLEKIGA